MRQELQRFSVAVQMIEEGMARTEQVACQPMIAATPSRIASRTPRRAAAPGGLPKGRCGIGWIVTNSGRDSWDVWLDVPTGEGRLRKQRIVAGERTGSRSSAARWVRPCVCVTSNTYSGLMLVTLPSSMVSRATIRPGVAPITNPERHLRRMSRMLNVPP